MRKSINCSPVVFVGAIHISPMDSGAAGFLWRFARSKLGRESSMARKRFDPDAFRRSVVEAYALIDALQRVRDDMVYRVTQSQQLIATSCQLLSDAERLLGRADQIPRSPSYLLGREPSRGEPHGHPAVALRACPGDA